ncbi:MAG: hypothetical protein NT051_00415 [Candidatus Micrarchaeota archaeon]|nr:hypothetical protein [Candidatus Micrarchaeota archaeon]
MNSYTIVKLEADCAAVEDGVLRNFNEYMQAGSHSPSFVAGNDGYFRIEYDESLGASSAAIERFGNFLVSSGYKISGISSAETIEGESGTEVRFFRETGNEERVVISTLNVY